MQVAIFEEVKVVTLGLDEVVQPKVVEDPESIWRQHDRAANVQRGRARFVDGGGDILLVQCECEREPGEPSADDGDCFVGGTHCASEILSCASCRNEE